jgi:5-methylthioadenosine/S-adenosylhomocysteine deaminase
MVPRLSSKPGIRLRFLWTSFGCLFVLTTLAPCTIAQSDSPVPAKLVIKHALILTMASGQRDPINGYLAVAADGRILTVAAGDPPASLQSAQSWDAGGHWVLPGFISAHSHLWQSAFRGLAADQTLPGWITAVYQERADKALPEDYYWFTLDGALDHLQHGVTSAYNFTYGGDFNGNQAKAPPEKYDESEFRAETDSGIRFVHGIDVGWATRPNAQRPFGAQQARVPLKEFLEWSSAQPKSSAFLSVMINGFVAFNSTYEQARMEKVLMDEFHLGNQAHYLEAPETQYEEQSKFRWFLDSGMLSKQLIFGHFIHTNSYILAESAKAGASMSWNPLSNGRLASGVADIPAYLKAGVRVGMGVDGEASADLADPFENMRTGLYAIRDKYENATIMSPYDVLRLHTMGSADVLGVSDRLGSLEPGKLADFLVVDPARFGPITDTYASLVFVAGERDLERVYVGGELLVRNGVLTNQDQAKVKAQVEKRVAGLR